MHYFGRWEDPVGAENEYLAIADDLHAGRVPRPQNGELVVTVRDVCNEFMGAKRLSLDSDNLSPRTFVQYDQSCRFLIEAVGANRSVLDLAPADFQSLYGKLARKFSTSSLGGQITQIRSIFKYAFEADLIERPVKYGPTFKAPSKTDVRKARAKIKHKNGSRVFEAPEILAMLDNASVQMKAMILLGINCGFGNTDCALLPQSAVDFEKGWIDFPRPKTGVERRIPIWPETLTALKEALLVRKEPADSDDEGIVFVTHFGQRWVRYSVLETKSYGKKIVKPKQDDGISKATAKLLKQLNLKRPGLSFYGLRHTFETVAGGTRDQVAVDAIMGHIDSSMAANYRHGIEDERLHAVVNHVRRWLYHEQKYEFAQN